MATYNWGVDRTFKAGMPNLGDYQYGFVKLGGTAACMVINASTIGGSVLGVLQNDPKSASDLAVVRVAGFTKIRVDTENAASPVIAGQWVKSASNGWAIGCRADKFAVAASTWCTGIALENIASGSGQYIEIYLKPLMLPRT